MGRPSVFETDILPELSKDLEDKQQTKRIYNRRYYLRHAGRIKVINKLYYRTHKQRMIEAQRRRKWNLGQQTTPKPVGVLEKKTPSALAEAKVGEQIYQDMKDKFYSELHNRHAGTETT